MKQIVNSNVKCDYKWEIVKKWIRQNNYDELLSSINEESDELLSSMNED